MEIPADPTALFRLLREAYVAGKSGHLHQATGGERRLLRVLRGRIIDGSSDVEGERLGDVLVRYGLVSRQHYENALAIVLRDRIKIGRVLAETGLLERSKLEDAIGLHVRELLFAMISRPGASFRFEELSESSIEADVSSPLSVGQLILEAARRIRNPVLVRQAIGDRARVLVLSEDPLLQAQEVTLTPVDRLVLSRIDGRRSAQDLLSQNVLAAEQVESSLYGLLCTGLVQHREARPVTSPLSVPSARARESVPETTPKTPQCMAASTRPTSDGAPLPGAGSARTPLPQTTQRAQTPSTPSAPQQATASPSTAPPTIASPAPARTSRTGVDEVRRTILEIHTKLEHATHYEVLGIEQAASDVEVRHAHARLVRALHPDACSGPEFEDLQQKRAEVFVRVRQAFEVIGDLQARAAYDTHLKLWNRNSAPPLERPNASARAEASGPCAAPEAPGELAPGPRDLALASLTSAEARFEAGQYWDVIQALEPLVPRLESGLRARARCLLARAYAKNPKWQHRAEGALRLVIEEDPNHVGAHLLLAQIYAAAGLTALARGIYRKVLALDPRNAEARAAAQMPEGEPPPHAQAPSTLKHLFRRN